MTPEAAAILALVSVIFPTAYFFLTSPAFLLVKLDVREVALLMRAHFHGYFVWLVAGAAFSSVAFAFSGRALFMAATDFVSALSYFIRRWFLVQIDRGIDALGSEGRIASNQLRGLHQGGMALNLIQLVLFASAIPQIFPK